MDKVQQIQSLHREGVPIKEIARRLGISRNSVKKYIRRLKDGPDAEELLLLSEAAYGSEQTEQSMRRHEGLMRFFAQASCALGRTGVTREILWGEYMQTHSDGYSYSQFCHHLKRYERNGDLQLHGEMHRFIPAVASFSGATMTEVDVRHHPRQFGQSKYNLSRTFRVISDLMLIYFMRRYSQKPIHIFGTAGFIAFFTGVLINLYLLGLKILGQDI